jgi:hypothetical protein
VLSTHGRQSTAEVDQRLTSSRGAASMTVRVWSMSAIVCAPDVRQAIQGQPTLTSEPIALELNVDLGLERVTELEDQRLDGRLGLAIHVDSRSPLFYNGLRAAS